MSNLFDALNTLRTLPSNVEFDEYLDINTKYSSLGHFSSRWWPRLLKVRLGALRARSFEGYSVPGFKVHRVPKIHLDRCSLHLSRSIPKQMLQKLQV